MSQIIINSPELQSKATAIRVYFCLLKGLNICEIAQQLEIGRNVARYHCDRIKKKMSIQAG